MKTVLVPTDFSKYASAGLKIAAAVAEKSGSPIVLHHNINSLVNWDVLSDVDRQKYPELEARTVEAGLKLDKMMREDIGADLIVNKAITHGITFEEITAKARQLHADLIVMGSHGNEASDRYFIGSNIQRVIRFAGCPVLASKGSFPRAAVERIVFPSDFESDLEQPFAEVKKLATAFGATIHLLFVNTPSKFKDTRTIREILNTFAAKHPGQKFVMSVYDHHDPVTGILEYCDDIQADMITMVTQDRRHTARYLLGITESVVFHANIPVWSVNSAVYERKLN